MQKQLNLKDMKKILFGLTALITFTLLSFSSSKHNHSTLTINTELSSVEWIGEKVTGKHNGTVKIKEGAINLHDGKLNTGKIIMDMESITCSDLEGEWSDKLVGHLKSADFFDVKNHKTATLDISNFSLKDGNKYNVKGNLTIKGITKPITFEASIEIKDNKLASFAEIKIDRTLYDIKYGSGKFFEGLGDKMIDDEFTIKFKIAAK